MKSNIIDSLDSVTSAYYKATAISKIPPLELQMARRSLQVYHPRRLANIIQAHPSTAATTTE